MFDVCAWPAILLGQDWIVKLYDLTGNGINPTALSGALGTPFQIAIPLDQPYAPLLEAPSNRFDIPTCAMLQGHPIPPYDVTAHICRY